MIIMEETEFVIETVKIPIKRVKEIKGDADSTLKMLERELAVHLEVDNEDGSVIIEGPSIEVFFAMPVIKAIGRGFEPRIALKLKDEEYGLKIIDLRDFAAKPNHMSRIKGRVIGEKGKSKEIIEHEAEVNIAIWGHTVGIIGKLELIDIAATAIFKLIEGMPHAGVFLYLEKNKRRRKEEEIKARGKMQK
ncbi:MAG: KH domain-containing protein [Candidatus Micrarchaeia archaeon]